MLNKYKYSLNRGLPITQHPKKKAITIKTYALISQKTPVLYEISTTQDGKSFVLYNDHEYMHRECEIVTEARPQEMLKEVQKHYKTNNDNGFTIFVANEPIDSDQIIMGLQEEQSLLYQTYRNLKATQSEGSEIVMSIVGVRGENALTDQLNNETLQPSEYGVQERNKPLLRLRNTQNQSSKYELQGLTRKHISDEKDLQQVVIRYKQLKNQSEYMSLAEKKYWDWLQGQLFIMKVIALDHDGQQITLKTHFILKINQYLQTTGPLMLKLGITLRRLQERTKRADNNQSKLFKVLSNCWINAPLKNIHLFLQIGHHLTLKEEYLLLVPTAEVTTSVTQASRNFQQLPFVYIKNYENYPKITAFLSKLNKPNDRYNKKMHSATYQEEIEYHRGRVRSYARDTFSSIEKKRINNIQREFQSQDEENKDLESIIQEAANLYKESNNESFRLSYYKRSNAEAMKKHKKMIQTLSAVSKPSSDLYRSERTKQKQTRRQLAQKTATNLFHYSTDYQPAAKQRLTQPETAYEIYTKGKKIRNVRQLSRMQQTKQYVDAMIKREILQLQKDDQIFLYDDQGQKETY